MTKKGFREAMMRGLGRCVLDLESTENVERYRERNGAKTYDNRGTFAGVPV